MNIPDEYWTTEAPTECGPYMMRIDNGEYVADSVVKVIGFHWEAGEPRKIVIAGGDITPQPVPREAKFCRLAPVAEVERLEAENERLHKLVEALRSDVATFGGMGERLKAANEKLRAWIKEAYGEGACSNAHWEVSVTKARLEGRAG